MYLSGGAAAATACHTCRGPCPPTPFTNPVLLHHSHPVSWRVLQGLDYLHKSGIVQCSL